MDKAYFETLAAFHRDCEGIGESFARDLHALEVALKYKAAIDRGDVAEVGKFIHCGYSAKFKELVIEIYELHLGGAPQTSPRLVPGAVGLEKAVSFTEQQIRQLDYYREKCGMKPLTEGELRYYQQRIGK